MTRESDRLVVITRAVTAAEFSTIDSRATAICLSDSVAAVSPALFQQTLHRRALLISTASGDVRPPGVALGLFADVSLLGSASVLDLGRNTEWWGVIAAGIHLRIGAGSEALLFSNKTNLDAGSAIGAGLCESVVAGAHDSLQWCQQWIGGRSLLALQSAASLLRRKGGDVTERAEFARLFASGEPQLGLNRFLNREAVDFRRSLMVEMV